MARASKAPTHVLLTGLPASAKMMLPFMVPTTYKGVIFGSAEFYLFFVQEPRALSYYT